MSLRVLTVWLCLLSSALAGASIEGRVPLPSVSTAAVIPQRYSVVSQGGVLQINPPLAVVYLEGSFPAATLPATARVIQKNLTFEPSLLPIRTGTRVEFPNEDDTFHNVFSFSPAKRFDLGRYQPDEVPVPSQVFETAGVVTLRCEIHEHMRALILVLDTPYFAKTLPDGSFRLTDLPAGRHTLKAWISSKQTLSIDVELRDGETTRVEFP